MSRNPLMIVKSMSPRSKVLEERGNWPEDLNQREADVSFAVERMMTLREELLAASRNEQRELDVVAQPLSHILRRVVRWGRVVADEKAIQLTEECPADLPYVMADDGALQSILTNLLSNAVRYTGNGGSIVVRARHEPPNVLIEFADTGIGIPKRPVRFTNGSSNSCVQELVVFVIGLASRLPAILVSSMGNITCRASQS